jgi:hypothetical protein
MIVFYIMDLSTKTMRNALFMNSTDSIIEKIAVMMRTATETEEKTVLKGVLLLSYYSLFEALVYK